MKEFPKKIECTITKEMIEDCVSHGNINSVVEMKTMVMDYASHQFDTIVLNAIPEHLRESVETELKEHYDKS